MMANNNLNTYAVIGTMGEGNPEETCASNQIDIEDGRCHQQRCSITGCRGMAPEQEMLDTITELPEFCEAFERCSSPWSNKLVYCSMSSLSEKPDDGVPRHQSSEGEVGLHTPELTGSVVQSHRNISPSKLDSSPIITSHPVPSSLSLSTPSSPPISGCLTPTQASPPKTDQEDALSADEGIQTSPPFETDDPWDRDSDDSDADLTPTRRRRRYSMSAVIQQTQCCREDGADGGTGVILRSPAKSWLADEMKARRPSRFRPKSCSLPHAEWLMQRTETALDQSAEMQRRTAELLRSARSVRDQEI